VKGVQLRLYSLVEQGSAKSTSGPILLFEASTRPTCAVPVFLSDRRVQGVVPELALLSG
jgi:hypothetical protein